MKITLAKFKSFEELDFIALGVSQTRSSKGKEKSKILENDFLKNLNKTLGNLLLKSAQEEGFEANLGQTFFINPLLPKKAFPKIALLGLGEETKQSVDGFRKSAADAFRLAECKKAKKIAYMIPRDIDVPQFDILQALAEGFLLASYKFDKYITKDKQNLSVQEIEILLEEQPSQDQKKALERAIEIAESVNLARDLINEGPNVLNPPAMAEHATKIAKSSSLSIEILDETKLKKERMNLLLAVGGAAEKVAPPRLIRLAYEPKGAKKTLCLVGKGVTFDSGGLNIKPADGMLDMKVDMSGAAAVLGIMKTIGKLKPKIKVVGYLACVENGVGPHSYHQGDVIISRKGLSVEITNTDAEGRLVLADAINYAIEKDQPNTLIDLATLTGACMIALGRNTAGLFTNNDELHDAIHSCGKVSGESFWRLPLSQDLKEVIKTPVADIKNCGDRYGGAITAALFLQAFIEENIAWAHLDIAGPATNTKTNSYHHIGGAGFGIRTLVDFIMGQ